MVSTNDNTDELNGIPQGRSSRIWVGCQDYNTLGGSRMVYQYHENLWDILAVYHSSNPFIQDYNNLGTRSLP